MNLEEFKNPRKVYRPSPFWSWNDALDIKELRWQVREFDKEGFGGYFMHSRPGLVTQYLSDEWMKCIRACLEEGRELGLESWLYDEDKWPSGFAGGFVPALGDEYRSKFIHMGEIKAEKVEQALTDPSTIGIFEVYFDPSNIMKEFKRIDKPDEIRGDGRLYIFKLEIPSRDNWFNGETYVDLLNPKVTEEFLKVTIDAYAKEFRRDFGEFMPGVFTDEPNYQGYERIPWTLGIAEYFRSLNGYDVTEKLPLLYFEGKDYQKVRYDFWRTITQRFIEAWTIPYSRRCDKLGLKMTGHYLYEDNLIVQTRHIGAAMPHYEYMHIPGIDHLSRIIHDPLTLKQCSSAAHQFGWSRVLSELFGASGQSMTFEDQKWIGDFHLALGISLFCPHLSLYTVKGETKRDFPPTFSYHQPYWKHLKLINDYFARGSYLCSQGRFYTDILLLHPIGSVWATFSPIVKDPSSPPWKYNEALARLIDDLLALHRDFDLGDEMIIARHAHIDGSEFIIKEGKYKIVIVPPSLTWSSKTVSLLEEFLEAGGKALFVGETPNLIDGKPAEKRWQKTLSHPNATSVNLDRRTVAEALGKMVPRSVSILNEEGNEVEDIYVHHRIDGLHHIYFLSNKSRTKKYNVVISLSVIGEATEWNMFDGSVSQVNAVTQQGRTLIRAVFNPVESHVFIVDATKPPAPQGSLPQVKFEERAMELPEKWSFKRLHLNSLVLDTCQYSLGDGRWSEKVPLWKVRHEAWVAAGLEKYTGIAGLTYTGIQPWVLIKKRIKPSRSFNLQLQFKFRSEVEGKQVSLVVERAPIWKLLINGKPVPTETGEWYLDKQFGKIDISDHVKIGENLIELSCRYDVDVPVEDVYLVGDFGVKKISETEFALIDEPEVLRNGDWVEQGYPFYAGTMRYWTKFNLQKKPGEQVLIRLPEAKGSLFLVSVNDKRPVPICWQPFEADVTNMVHDGENKLTIDVVNTLRNTFGPFHHKLGDPYIVGPFTFTDQANWVDAYQLVPYGLIKGAEVVIQRR